MNMVVYKYPVELNKVDDEITVYMPKGHHLISVVNQYEKLTFYAVVSSPGEDGRHDPSDDVLHKFVVVGTGQQSIPPDAIAHGKFLGTVLFRSGSFVLHVWDMGIVQ